MLFQNFSIYILALSKNFCLTAILKIGRQKEFLKWIENIISWVCEIHFDFKRFPFYKFPDFNFSPDMDWLRFFRRLFITRKWNNNFVPKKALSLCVMFPSIYHSPSLLREALFNFRNSISHHKTVFTNLWTLFQLDSDYLHFVWNQQSDQQHSSND
jgi:hypothetical protein